MATAAIDIHDIFSSIAGKYDSLNSILTLNIDRLWRRKAIKISKIEKDSKVLDLCCGTGKMIEYECKKVGKDIEVVGLDFNQEMINVGYSQLNKSIKDYKYKLMKGDVMELPFEDNSFHCITIAFGLRNVQDKNKALLEMHRVLKPGGRLVCLELSKPEVPVLKNIYNAYFNDVLPLIGYLGTRDKKAYYYLRDSVNNFMTKKQLKAEFEKCGFINSEYISLTCGAASIHYGNKLN